MSNLITVHPTGNGQAQDAKVLPDSSLMEYLCDELRLTEHCSSVASPLPTWYQMSISSW